jgi:hypothetical protein
MIAETSVSKGHAYRVYGCASYHVSGPASGCGHNNVEDARMVRAVARKLEAAFTTPEAVAELRAEIARQEREALAADPAPALEARETDLTARIGRLIDQLGDDLPASALADVRAKVRDLSAERDRVRLDLAAARSAPARPGPDERVGAFVARVHRLAEVLQRGDPAAVSALLRELIDRIEVFFTHKRTAKQTRSAFAHALVYPNPQGWIVPEPSNLSGAPRCGTSSTAPAGCGRKGR